MKNKLSSTEFRLWISNCCKDAEKEGLSEDKICEVLIDALIAKLWHKKVENQNAKTNEE